MVGFIDKSCGCIMYVPHIPIFLELVKYVILKACWIILPPDIKSSSRLRH